MDKKSTIRFCREHGIDESFAALSTRGFNFMRRFGIKNKTDAVKFYQVNTFEMIKLYPSSLNYGVVTDAEIRQFLHD